MSRRFTSPYRQTREQAEISLREEHQKQQTLEEELRTVQQALQSVRAGLGSGTPAASSYGSLSRALAPTHTGGTGIEDYYVERLRKVLGSTVKVHNLLQSPGVSIEETFGVILQSASDGMVPWIITDDHWADDLHKSHFHNILQTASGSDQKVNVNILILTGAGSAIKAEEPKKDVALYAMTYGCAYVAAVSHKLDNTRLLSTLTEASEFNGPSIVTAPATVDMLSAMQNSELPEVPSPFVCPLAAAQRGMI
jgi:hypothetical protein